MKTSLPSPAVPSYKTAMNMLDLPSGFRFSGVVSGLRSEPNRRDIAVIMSDRPAVSAGVFTQNQVCAAPVLVSRERIGRADSRGFVVCSGNANACTGDQGLLDAKRMTELVAQALGCDVEQILVASTGVIGRPLPMPILERGVPLACDHLRSGEDAFLDAAHAILTTDTVIKTASVKLGSTSVAGFAKGAAMIGPNMATMLGFLLTDASVSSADLQSILRDAADATFNCISVEGHMSTNDTVLMLANGQGPVLEGAELEAFAKATRQVCADLAMQIAKDAEGANHLVTIVVEGARDDREARIIAKTVSESALVKTAIFGADPNWGRVVSAAGYSGVKFAERELSLTMGDFLLYSAGQPLPFDAASASAYLKANRDVNFRLTLTQGEGRCTFYTCDLTYKYVELNADYTT
jgi:glutamate N-acetyltransferase / amino-acid N-acetyltransferase